MNIYLVEIEFIIVSRFQTEVSAINKYQAMQTALSVHRERTSCGFDEMYDYEKSKVTLIK